MGFAKVMSSLAGRVVRIVAGLALIAVGVWVVGGTGGILLALVGAVPFVAGIFNFCVFAPLFGGPFNAKHISFQP